MIEINTVYRCTRTGKDWAIVREIDYPNTVTAEMPDGRVVEFGYYEIISWVGEEIIKPVCGLCNQPVNRLDFHSHVRMHLYG